MNGTGDVGGVDPVASASGANATLPPLTDPFPLEEEGDVWLTHIERRIFGVIRATIEHYGLQVVPRVAGGWVRDKLLELDSDDLDFSLDGMMGEDFARIVTEYIAETAGQVRKASVGVIKSNPAQSKHLNTATFKLFGRAVDANNLRTETYENDSRIPLVAMGTTRDDCLRRDFTANSMYYNVLTRKVEDISGTGLWDLTNRVLHTPLPAFKTFNDDPLRVLRCARFAGRFGFHVTLEIDRAATHPSVHKNLLHKVSRERFGIETRKMLHCLPAVVDSFSLLTRWGLRPVVFVYPKPVDDPSLVAQRRANNAGNKPAATAIAKAMPPVVATATPMTPVPGAPSAAVAAEAADKKPKNLNQQSQQQEGQMNDVATPTAGNTGAPAQQQQQRQYKTKEKPVPPPIPKIPAISLSEEHVSRYPYYRLRETSYLYTTADGTVLTVLPSSQAKPPGTASSASTSSSSSSTTTSSSSSSASSSSPDDAAPVLAKEDHVLSQQCLHLLCCTLETMQTQPWFAGLVEKRATKTDVLALDAKMLADGSFAGIPPAGSASTSMGEGSAASPPASPAVGARSLEGEEASKPKSKPKIPDPLPPSPTTEWFKKAAVEWESLGNADSPSSSSSSSSSSLVQESLTHLARAALGVCERSASLYKDGSIASIASSSSSSSSSSSASTTATSTTASSSTPPFAYASSWSSMSSILEPNVDAGAMAALAAYLLPFAGYEAQLGGKGKGKSRGLPYQLAIECLKLSAAEAEAVDALSTFAIKINVVAIEFWDAVSAVISLTSAASSASSSSSSSSTSTSTSGDLDAAYAALASAIQEVGLLISSLSDIAAVRDPYLLPAFVLAEGVAQAMASVPSDTYCLPKVQRKLREARAALSTDADLPIARGAAVGSSTSSSMSSPTLPSLSSLPPLLTRHRSIEQVLTSLKPLPPAPPVDVTFLTSPHAASSSTANSRPAATHGGNGNNSSSNSNSSSIADVSGKLPTFSSAGLVFSSPAASTSTVSYASVPPRPPTSIPSSSSLSSSSSSLSLSAVPREATRDDMDLMKLSRKPSPVPLPPSTPTTAAAAAAMSLSVPTPSTPSARSPFEAPVDKWTSEDSFIDALLAAGVLLGAEAQQEQQQQQQEQEQEKQQQAQDAKMKDADKTSSVATPFILSPAPRARALSDKRTRPADLASLHSTATISPAASATASSSVSVGTATSAKLTTATLAAVIASSTSSSSSYSSPSLPDSTESAKAASFSYFPVVLNRQPAIGNTVSGPPLASSNSAPQSSSSSSLSTASSALSSVACAPLRLPAIFDWYVPPSLISVSPATSNPSSSTTTTTSSSSSPTVPRPTGPAAVSALPRCFSVAALRALWLFLDAFALSLRFSANDPPVMFGGAIIKAFANIDRMIVGKAGEELKRFKFVYPFATEVEAKQHLDLVLSGKEEALSAELKAVLAAVASGAGVPRKKQ